MSQIVAAGMSASYRQGRQDPPRTSWRLRLAPWRFSKLFCSLPSTWDITLPRTETMGAIANRTTAFERCSSGLVAAPRVTDCRFYPRTQRPETCLTAALPPP